MSNLIKTEIYKWIKSKTFWGLFIYILLIITFFSLFGENKIIAKDIVTYLEDPIRVFMLVFPIVYLLGMTISYEFKTGYIENAAANGYSRETIYFSKQISYFFAIIIFCVILFSVVFLAVMLSSGYGDDFIISDLYILFKIFLISIFLIIAISSFVSMISFISRNVEVLVVIFFLDIMIFNLQQGIQKEWFRRIIDYHIYNRFIIALGENSGYKEIVLMLSTSIIAVFLFNFIAIYRFKKCDI
ncbi:MAG: ABC transporter permease [Candidatus Woesearchaeota archaeon]